MREESAQMGAGVGDTLDDVRADEAGRNAWRRRQRVHGFVNSWQQRVRVHHLHSGSADGVLRGQWRRAKV